MIALSVFGWEVMLGLAQPPHQRVHKTIPSSKTQEALSDAHFRGIMHVRRWRISVASACNLQSCCTSQCFDSTLAFQPSGAAQIPLPRATRRNHDVTSSCCCVLVTFWPEQCAPDIFQKPYAERTCNQCARGASTSTSAFQMSLPHSSLQ